MTDDLLANRLRQRRKELGLSLEDLAELTGYAKTTLHRYEKSSHNNLSVDKIKTLSSALDVSPAYLMGLESLKTNSEVISKLENILETMDILIEYDPKEDNYILLKKYTKFNDELNNEINFIPALCRRDINLYRIEPDNLSNLYSDIISYVEFRISKELSIKSPLMDKLSEKNESINLSKVSDAPKGYDYKLNKFTDTPAALSYLKNNTTFKYHPDRLEKLSKEELIDYATILFNIGGNYYVD